MWLSCYSSNTTMDTCLSCCPSDTASSTCYIYCFSDIATVMCLICYPSDTVKDACLICCLHDIAKIIYRRCFSSDIVTDTYYDRDSSDIATGTCLICCPLTLPRTHSSFAVLRRCQGCMTRLPLFHTATATCGRGCLTASRTHVAAAVPFGWRPISAGSAAGTAAERLPSLSRARPDGTGTPGADTDN